MIRRAAGVLLGLVVAATVLTLAVPLAVMLWRASGDPLAALPVATTPVRVIEDTREAVDLAGVARVVRRVTLDGGALGPIRFAISLPARSPLPVPALVLLGGMRKGADQVDAVPDLGANALVAYEYPFGRRLRAATLLGPRALPRFQRQVFSVPGQVSALIRWLRTEPEIDGARVSLIGASLGGLYFPAAHRLAASRGLAPGPGVFGFASADLGPLLRIALEQDLPDLVATPLARAAARLLAPLEPAAHLPRLRGPFLVLHGTADGMIPAEGAARMVTLTPAPRQVVEIGGGHVGDADAVTRRAVALTRSWLTERGRLSPGR